LIQWRDGMRAGVVVESITIGQNDGRRRGEGGKRI
jgi:hypothetical protein